MVGDPPVVMLITASVDCLMRGRNCMNIAGSPVGRPSLGSRACRCRIAAPASAAPMACSAIWSGVTGKASDMVGGWIALVTARVMMPLSDFAAIGLSRSVGGASFRLKLCGHPPQSASAAPAAAAASRAAGEKPPNALRRQQHHCDGDGAQHEKIETAEVGKGLPQSEKHDGADDGPLHPADPADHRDEDDEGGPVVDAERGVGGDAQLLQED